MEPTRVRERRETIERIGSLVQNILRELVDEPDIIKMVIETLPNGANYRITVPFADRGKIIGKQGRTARAIRTLLVGMSGTSRLNLQIDIVDEEGNYGYRTLAASEIH